MGNLEAIRGNAETIRPDLGRGEPVRRMGTARRHVASARGRRITWYRERPSVMFGICFCAAMLAFMLVIGLTGGANYEDALRWLCYWCAALAAISDYAVCKMVIRHGVSRRTILFTQWAGNACIAAANSIMLAIAVGLSHLLFRSPWRQGVHAGRLEMISGYADALSWNPRFIDETTDGALQTRTGWSYWAMFLLSAFLVLFAAMMVGQLVGEICSHLGAVRSIVVGLITFMVATLAAQMIYIAGWYDVVDRLAAASLGFIQRGSPATGDWSAAYSIWPLLATMVAVSAACMAVTAALTMRREMLPVVAK